MDQKKPSTIIFDHYAIAVSDVEVSLAFYVDVLGFAQVERPGFDFVGAWLDIGQGRTLHLIENDKTRTVDSSSRSLHFAYRVSDIYAWKAYLLSMDVHIAKDIKPRPDGVLQLFILDPDGYWIELTEMKN
jgi:lactoylglutathione lyase